ncbi:MAG: PspA/IM30 family protein [Marinosulfonomonas sp.]
MLKQIMTLARGRVVDTSQAYMDANALSLLRQQIREAAQGVEKSRKAVAVVMAYAQREKTSLARIEAQIADLETRALDALAKDQDALASEAAGTIAHLEAERDMTRKAIETYRTEIARLKQCLAESETCLREMKRGQHLAEANQKAIHVRGVMQSNQTNDLKDASETLKRLQERQEHAEATAAAVSELSIGTNAETMSDRLAAAGCGAPLRSDATAVLERLKAQKKSS